VFVLSVLLCGLSVVMLMLLCCRRLSVRMSSFLLSVLRCWVIRLCIMGICSGMVWLFFCGLGLRMLRLVFLVSWGGVSCWLLRCGFLV